MVRERSAPFLQGAAARAGLAATIARTIATTMPRTHLFAIVLAIAGCDSSSSPPLDAAAPLDARTIDAAPLDAAPLDAAPLDASTLDATTPTGTRYGMPQHVGTLPATGLPEVSGIVASRAHSGIFWVENDSGNPADIFAIDASGALVATIHLDGATNSDWEDIAIDARAGVEELYVADVGDNAARESDGASGRARVSLYRLPEPDVTAGDATVTPERFDFSYPTRPYDCEALFVDHRSGDVYFVMKESSPAEVFVARAPLDASATAVLTHVGTIDFTIATAADMSTDGARIVVRGYSSVRVYPVAVGGDVATAFSSEFLTARSGASAEAVAFEHDGFGLYNVPEGNAARLFYIPSE